jgi:LPXTG-motif cell wall-anchored protein
MLDEHRPRVRRSGWTIFVVALTAAALGVIAAVAIAQETTPTQTQTTTTQTTPAEQPTVPEGFTEDECDRQTQPDGSQTITCQREQATQRAETRERTAEARAEEQAALEATVTGETDTVEVIPVGGTGAGAGGTAGEDGSILPFLIGFAGLAMAGTAAVLARRRRYE